MNAPVPPGSATPENGQPTEEQLDLFGAPGIATGAPDAADEQDAKDKKRAKEAAAVADFLSWEELEDEIKSVFADKATEILPRAHNLYDTINNATRSMRNDRGAAAIPRTVEGSPHKNAHLFVNMLNNLLPPSPELLGKAMNGLKVNGSAGDAVFVSSTGNGAVTLGQKGIFFQAGQGESALKRKPFTQDDARAMALLAMHNKDLLPPNSIKLTGSPQQQALIKNALDELNANLPEGQRLEIHGSNKPGADAKQERGQSRLGQFWNRVTGKKPAADAGAPAAAAPAAAATDDVLDLTAEDIVPAPTSAGEELGESMAQSMIDEVRGVQAAPEGPIERDVLEETLNLYPDQILKVSEKVGEFDTTDHGRQDLFKARIQPPSSDLSNMKDVIFHQAGDRLKILAVEGDYMFDKLLERNVEGQALSALNDAFGTAGQGETPSVAENDENFIGPRTPAGWTPPAPPSA